MKRPLLKNKALKEKHEYLYFFPIMIVQKMYTEG